MHITGLVTWKNLRKS